MRLTLIPNGRKALIRLAASLPVGSAERRTILAGISDYGDSLEFRTSVDGSGQSRSHRFWIDLIKPSRPYR